MKIHTVFNIVITGFIIDLLNIINHSVINLINQNNRHFDVLI
jgi:hypothetical protein